MVYEFNFRRNNGHCMRDKPALDMTESKTRVATFAGEAFSPDHQCQLVFGHGSVVCSYMVNENIMQFTLFVERGLNEVFRSRTHSFEK